MTAPMILGPKTEKVIKIIIDEGPQHISKIKKRLGSGSKQSIDYLKKVGVLKRDEQRSEERRVGKEC